MAVSGSSSGTSGQRKKRALAASGMEAVITAVEKLPLPTCHECEDSLPSARLHACLDCIFLACWKDHLHSHMNGKGHSFAMDFSNCTLYCLKCKDYVYDDEFEKILFAEQYYLDYIVSRIREPFASKPIHPLWVPSLAEQKDISTLSTPAKCTGIRGLLNLGSTCFMNCILQVILHNPLFKAHFFSDKHAQEKCHFEPKETCMACQLDELYAEAYSTRNNPLAPHGCLRAMWIGTHMAGYSQQDAHEFFISFLDQVHKSSGGSGTFVPSDGGSGCKCITHHVFGGVLQSDVTCTGCKAISLTYDPILDISLEIKNVTGKRDRSKKGEEKTVTLLDCLEAFTLPEKLGTYTCKSCNGTEVEALKQLSVNILPPVLAVQLKRFEHSENSSSKIDTFVKIPEKLDMTPLTTRAVKMKCILAQGLSAKTRIKPTLFDTVSDGIPSYKYSLFGVVCHQGKIDTGHYKSYCRVKDGWFLFDDHNVTSVELSDVFKANAYMVFYVKDHCEYSPNEIPGLS